MLGLSRIIRVSEAASGISCSPTLALHHLHQVLGGHVIPGISLGSRHGQPLKSSHGFYVLLESTGGHAETDAARFETALEAALESELITDAVIAQSKQQRGSLWSIRDDIETLHRTLHPAIPFDISLGIAQMHDFVNEVRKQRLITVLDKCIYPAYGSSRWGSPVWVSRVGVSMGRRLGQRKTSQQPPVGRANHLDPLQL